MYGTAPLRGEYAPASDLDAAFESGVRPVEPGGETTPRGAAGICAHLRALAYGGPERPDAECDGLCVLTNPLAHFRAD